MTTEHPLHKLLAEYREQTKNTRDQGKAFERLVQAFLKNDPRYSSQYRDVWMWADWEFNFGQDCGIDLVAEDFAGNYTAIQCKFYSPDYQMEKKDIDSFFTESGRKFKVDGKTKSFSYRIIVSTVGRWSPQAQKSIEDQEKPTTVIGIDDLESSSIDWSRYSFKSNTKVALKEKKKLRPHQVEAIEKVSLGFKAHDRGKIVMACGTGKTFTALKLAEKVVGSKGNVLFLVPSISLLSQTLDEWAAESENPFHKFAVCSDKKVGRDEEDLSIQDLSIPATTDVASLLTGLEAIKKDKRMTVVFSTYQSIDVISKAQAKGLPEFDLIICDEAHRTTGVTLANQEESHFVKVHDQKFIKGKKRLYMTATPRIFGDKAKAKANEAGAELCSMDDVSKFGPEFHRLGFGKAVNDGLLTDYKVLVLAVDEKALDPKFQKQFANEDGEIPIEDIAKIIGCWNGLSKKFTGEEADAEDKIPMKRAVAFSRSIKDSKKIRALFEGVVNEYSRTNKNGEKPLHCVLEHVDGTFNVLRRKELLRWLKDEPEENTCRILTNARCLSEGVDVPALDAVLFLNSRDSQVDVVQSVGRIMRRAEGKKYGYIILPIVIPAGLPPEEALKKNDKYEVVWKVLQALRAHDDRFDATINQIELNKKRPNNIQVIGISGGSEPGEGGAKGGGTQTTFNFPEIEEWKDSIYARIVLKCGSRPYWENWAKDVAKIAAKHSEHIKKLLAANESKPRKAFDKFLGGIRKNINPNISEDDAIEMLSQHLITKPVFDALFEHYPFTEKNPVSRSMQAVLKVLESDTFKDDAAKLKGFYDSVRLRIKGIDNAEGRQKVIVELYDRFFKEAFPKMSERLGIVYTPIEVVDFIINSVQEVLTNEFQQSLADRNVQILDPFTGTGTFIVRLLQSGIVGKSDLKRKFSNELHANEIVLLAYYIAAINIEETFHSVTGGEYSSFDGIVLTDTFQLNESEAQGTFEGVLPENTERVERQRKLPIQVIISNPPYSAGQKDGNDNNQNLDYPKLDSRIAATFARESTATNKNSLYDSYIRGIRWALDRINSKGVVGFVTNGSFIDSNAADGVRKTLGKELAKIYCFNLRGNARTQGEERRKEKGNVFGEGTRTPVAITLFVKDSAHQDQCEILYHDIGDYLSREEKLAIVQKFQSIKNVPWQKINPNEEGDWVNQRSDIFEVFLSLGSKINEGQNKIFTTYSAGVKTNRDAWCYNFSEKNLSFNISKTLATYNSDVTRLQNKIKNEPNVDLDKFVENDEKKISWNRGLKNDLARGKKFSFDGASIFKSLYRPFTKQYLYFNKNLNDMIYQLPKLFPTKDHENLVIGVTGVGSTKLFSALVTQMIPDLEYISKSQCFPLYYYTRLEDEPNPEMFSKSQKTDKHGYVRRSAISEWAVTTFQKTYADTKISAEDVFYYVYGVLHSQTYRDNFQYDLKKMLPRIPLCKDFSAFSKSGKSLAQWHLNYETIEPFPLKEEASKDAPKNTRSLYAVDSSGMKWPKNGKEPDKTKIIFNNYVTLSGVPLEAYDYVVNGKSALEWVMERYCITTDLNAKGEGSGIKNDPNEWSDDPRYIIDLVKRVVRVSVETNKIVKSLPPLEIIEPKK